MNYKDKFILRKKENNKLKFEIYSYLMERPDNGNIIAESVGYIHYIAEIKKEDFNNIVNLETAINECENIINEDKKSIENIKNLPSYSFMRRIILLRKEIKINEYHLDIFNCQYNKTNNEFDLQSIINYKKQIQNMKKGIKRLTKRIYKQIKEHPEIDFENLEEYHYSKSYFNSEIHDYENIIKTLKTDF